MHQSPGMYPCLIGLEQFGLKRLIAAEKRKLHKCYATVASGPFVSGMEGGPSRALLYTPGEVYTCSHVFPNGDTVKPDKQSLCRAAFV
jgi:hypothetical protein